MRTILLSCAACATLLGAAEIQINEREVLAPERFVLEPGETKTCRPRLKKESGKWKPEERLGLRVRAFGKQSSYSGWNRLMQLKINGKVVERFNLLKQPRLVNRPDIMKQINAKGNRHYGESWYFPYSKSWNVCFGPEIPKPPQLFSKSFAEDVTNYLFDIDDLAAVDLPVEVVIHNIAGELGDMQKLIKLHRWKFPLVICEAELVKFVNPPERASGVAQIPPPTEEEIGALRGRLTRHPEFSAAGYRAELENLRYAESAFSDCERTWQIPYTIPGHLWLAYGFYHAPEKYIPLLDRAKEAGVGLIKVHAHWADIDGQGPFTIPSESGRKSLRGLAKLCHDRGMKFIVYVSPAWVKRNAAYDPAWELSDPASRSNGKTQWGRICTASPEWRSFFFKGVQSIFDDFPEVDGIYVDYGIDEYIEKQCKAPNHVHAFHQSKNPLGASEDMYHRLYALCRKNGKLMYVFAESVPGTQGYCDVHYVGESTPTMEAHRERHRDFKGNIFFLQMKAYSYYSQREVYGSTMALGHFPLAYGYKEAHRDPKGEPLWFRYFLGLWREMSLPGTHVYRGVRNSPLWKGSPEKDLIVTAFVNTSSYLVIYNCSESKTRQMTFTRELENLETGKKAETFSVPPRDLIVLRLR